MTEAQFLAAVLDLARLFGWRAYHTHDSRRSAPGFPDLVLVKPPRIVFAELKSLTGRVTAEQAAWLADLRACGLTAGVWTPRDLQDVARTLGPVLDKEAG